MPLHHHALGLLETLRQRFSCDCTRVLAICHAARAGGRKGPVRMSLHELGMVGEMTARGAGGVDVTIFFKCWQTRDRQENRRRLIAHHWKPPQSRQPWAIPYRRDWLIAPRAPVLGGVTPTVSGLDLGGHSAQDTAGQFTPPSRETAFIPAETIVRTENSRILCFSCHHILRHYYT